ncbi:hypothetical protein HGG72_11315 [Ochrobactrum pecoris]|uniref:Uncharacterized protein n=1 Tax=Brucella pecoris TaxID=867683 RepID=A0A5C5CW17_9HYPH|nr:hypothetical protein [Brucella pecoris]MBB4093026.1 hypothetical protein [Brucella pecoris]NKW80805.1 hypothetical protein [Brucella pecoris]TNV14816.1 hypothetical protein FIB18_06290 [Brucella pecoris]
MQLKIVEKPARGEARIRLAHQLQIAHGIDPADMAELLSVSVSQYLNRLNRLNLACSSAKPDAEKRARDAILERLQTELKRLLEGGDLPDKSNSEALMALARAVKSVGELTAEEKTTAQPSASNAVASLSETRKALTRLNRRINELAERRAREILDGGPDAAASGSSGDGVAVPGA